MHVASPCSTEVRIQQYVCVCVCETQTEIPPATHSIMAPCGRSNCSVIVEAPPRLCHARLRCVSPGEGASAAPRLRRGLQPDRTHSLEAAGLLLEAVKYILQ